MGRTIIAALPLTLIIVLVSGATNVKDRWLQPVLVFAAPTLVLWLLPKRPKIAWQRLFQIIVVVALLIIVTLPLHNLYGGTKKPSRRSAPFAGLSKAIKEKYPAATVVFAQSKWIGGNLRYTDKDWLVETAGNSSENLKGKVILVWQSNRQQVLDHMLKELQSHNRTIAEITPTTTVNLPYPANPEAIFSASFATAIIE